jgi:hypothetical protein
VRLTIAIPCHDSIARETTLSLGMMMFEIGNRPPEGLEWVGIDWRSSSNLPQSRAILAERALNKHGATHILWIDSDMAFPKESLHRLAAHKVDLVGVNYPRRGRPHLSAAMDSANVPFAPGQTGLTPCTSIGFGLFLMDVQVLAALPKPWFAHHDEHGYITEDIWFCRLMRERGRRIFVDHDLSREVKHIASLPLGAEDIVAYEEP